MNPVSSHKQHGLSLFASKGEPVSLLPVRAAESQAKGSGLDTITSFKPQNEQLLYYILIH
jgi:hypothetical protein